MSWLRTLRFRLRALFRKNTLDADMAEEMRLHLELRAERNRAAGMSVAEADHAAHRSFGGVEQIKERARDARGLQWLEQTAQDLRFAIRQLLKTPGFTAAAVLSLAIGIGLNTAVFSIINTLFYQSIRGVPEPQRVLIFNEGGASVEGFAHLQREMAGAAQITASRGTPAIVSLGGFERKERIELVDTNYFGLLGVRASLGRLFAGAPGEQVEPVAVLNDAFWRRQLGADRGVIGSIVRLNGAAFTVIGIAAPDFHGPGPEGPPMWVPLGSAPLIEGDAGVSRPKRLGLLGRLLPGVSLARAQATLDVVLARSPQIFGEKPRHRLSVGREDWRGKASAEKRVEFLLVTTVPLVVVAGLLWIACSNVGNLLLARAVQRQKEIAIRLASGATRGRLVRMLMCEGLLLALLGGAGGLWVSRFTLDFIFATLSSFSALSVQLDSRVLLYTVAVSVGAALLFGLAPAWQASKTDVNAALKGESSNPALRTSRLRAFFLASQIASSVALLVVAGTFIKSLVASAYVGAQARQIDRLLFAQLPETDAQGLAREAAYEAARAATLALPGIEAATLVEQGRTAPRRFSKPGEPPRQAGEPGPEVGFQRIDDSFFRAIGGTLLRGQPLAASAPVGVRQQAVVNDTLARRFWSIESALGQSFEADDQPFEVVGIVNDGNPNPAVYTHRPTDGSGRFALLIRTRGKAKDHVVAVSSALRSGVVASSAPIVTPYRELAFNTMSQITRLASFVGVLALALAAAGIYASMAFSTSQRTREIGVRMALGATRQGIVFMVLRDGLKVVSWGSAAGFVLALVGLRLLLGLLGWRTGIDLVAIVAVMIFFGLVTLLACLVPARRASKVDPMRALRAE